MKLLTGKDLAAEIGRSEWWVCQIKKAGMPFYCGKITLQEALNWMREHPDFTAVDYSATPSGTRRGRPPKGADKCGVPSRSRGQQTALPTTETPHRVQAS